MLLNSFCLRSITAVVRQWLAHILCPEVGSPIVRCFCQLAIVNPDHSGTECGLKRDGSEIMRPPFRASSTITSCPVAGLQQRATVANIVELRTTATNSKVSVTIPSKFWSPFRRILHRLRCGTQPYGALFLACCFPFVDLGLGPQDNH